MTDSGPDLRDEILTFPLERLGEMPRDSSFAIFRTTDCCEPTSFDRDSA